MAATDSGYDAKAGASPCVICATVVVLGLAMVVVGTFLPWTSSGSVDRQLYQSVGVLGRLGLLPGDVASLGGPLLGTVPVVLLAPVAVWVFGARRSAAVLSAILGAVVVACTTWLLGMAAGRQALGVGLSAVGPATCLVGGAIAAIAGLVMLAIERRSRPRSHHPA